MDIITHTLSGLAVGTVLASFSKKGILQKTGIVMIGGFGAALPDFDAISLWSGFDSNIGNLFNLKRSGAEIYSAQLWYSHHAFLHSIFASVFIALFVGSIFYIVKSKLKKLSFQKYFFELKSQKLVAIAFVLGFIIHLIGDMPTPSSTWGGVKLLFPWDTYYGGAGDIWWWNNYDIFLIVSMVVILNIIALLLTRIIKLENWKITLLIFLMGLAFSFKQIKTRDYDYSYKDHTSNFHEYERQSKNEQKRILGDKLYKLMGDLDNKIPLNF